LQKKRKTDRQITNRLNVDASLTTLAYRRRGQSPVAYRPAACHMPANHSGCRYAIRGDRVPVAGTRYTTYK